MSQYSKFDPVNSSKQHMKNKIIKTSKNSFFFTLSKIILATLLLTAATLVLFPISASAEITSYNYVFEVCSFNKQIKFPKIEVTSDSERKIVYLKHTLKSNTCQITSATIKAADQNSIKATLMNKGSTGKITTLSLNSVTGTTTPVTSPTTNTVTSSTVTTSNLSNVVMAGWRSSEYGNDNPYGHDQSDPNYWIGVAQQMSSKFPGSVPGGVLVIGEIDGSPGKATSTFMPFPKPSGTYPNVTFGTTDAIEPLLTAYDKAGLKVYLQVESADADIPMLMDLVMNRYKQHPSVIGFGIDVEWYHQKQYPDGRPLTANEVTTWAMKVSTYNPNYFLMVKHWDPSYLSNARPTNVLFLTDSEQIGSLSSAITEYIDWVDHFGTSQVGFQIGYPSDMSWWSKLSDPTSSMINPVIEARPNANIGAVYWVDFSVLKEFPP